eukprot:gene42251-51593_t
MTRANSFASKGYVPPPLPLAPFPNVSGEDLREYAAEVVTVLGEAAIPTRPDQLLALVLSEAAAGFVGGLSAKGAAFVLGDKSTNRGEGGAYSAAYFAVRGLAASLGAGLGLPAPLSRLLSGLLATASAEILKIESRRGPEEPSDSEEGAASRAKRELAFLKREFSQELREMLGSSSPPSTMSAPALVSGAEVIGDLAKWVAYDLLRQGAGDGGLQDAALCGLQAGLLAYGVSELVARRRPGLLRGGQAALEGAALFWAYEACINVIEGSSALRDMVDPQLRSFLTRDFIQLPVLTE